MTKSLTRTTARIYGALTALGDGSPDLLERLLPFFEPILRPLQGSILDLGAFAREVRDTYKWNFNTDVVEVFIPRLRDAGWIKAVDPSVKQTSYIITLPDQILNVETEATAQRELRVIAEKFRTFSESLSPLVEISMDVEQLEEILIEWLLYVEAFSEQNLDFKTRTVKDPSGTLRQVVDVPRTTVLKEEEIVLCARFVEHAITSDPEASETLARIASIGLLTEVVQDFVKPDTPVETSNLSVYLDAPVAMEFLGVSGRAARENIEPVIAELRRIGANVRIFSQSVDEISNNLKAVLANPHPTGPTAQALARGEVYLEYVNQISADPGNFLDEAGIRVTHRALDQFPAEHAHFTEDQRGDLYSALTFQQSINARAHDTDVTTLIIRQRGGYEDRDIFKSRFLLMTRNGLLAQLVRKRCVEWGVISPHSIPPVVHRRVITASMWLRTGLGANDLDIPKRLLLANCERVLAIRPGVINEVKRVAEALGDEEKVRQLDVLVKQHRSTQMLMDKTLGATSVVNQENFGELFDQMLHPYLEEERIRGETAVRKELEKGERRVEEARSELEQARSAETAVVTQLSERSREDRAVVDALCEDVTKILITQRRDRKRMGVALAVVMCSAPLFGPSEWVSYLSVILAVPLVYLTITGNRWIGTEFSEEHAEATLSKIADERNLSTKLSRYKVDWSDDHFSVADRGDTDTQT